MSLAAAILAAETEVASYHPGTKLQPEPGTTGYFSLRAAAVGLIFLKRLESLAIEGDAAACERLYRGGCSYFGKVDPLAKETPPYEAPVAAAIALMDKI